MAQTRRNKGHNRSGAAAKQAKELEKRIIEAGGLPSPRTGKQMRVYLVHPNSTAATKWGKTTWTNADRRRIW